VFRRVLDGSCVYVDPAAQEADFSDARFLIYAAFMPLDTFRETYPEAQYKEASDFKSVRDAEPRWVQPGGECNPLVAEVFYRVPYQRDAGHGKKRTDYEIWRAVVTGREIIEDAPWLADQNGRGRRYIPFVPYIGRELQPIDGERLWEGIIRPARDAQRLHNASISTFTERMMMEPKSPFVADAESISKFKDMWDVANVENQPVLLYDSKGGTMAPPQRAQLDSTGMSMAVLGMQQSRDLVHGATAVYEPSLGQLPRQKDAQSGRAIQALQQQSDAGTSYILDNTKLISIPLEARILRDMIAVVYDRPGRVTQVLGVEDERKKVMLGVPFVTKNGMPVPAKGDPKAETYDLTLTNGKYSVTATVGKNAQTRLQQGQEFQAAVIQAVPALVPLIGDLIFKFRDEPGAREIAERIRREIQAKMPHLLKSPDGTEDAAAKAAALEQQLQQLTQQLQQMDQFIKTDQAKHQVTFAIAQLEAQKAIRVAELNAQNRLDIARLTASRDASSQVAEAHEEVINTTLKTTAAHAENALDREHEERMQRRERPHDVGMAAASGSTMTMKREGGQDTSQEGPQ
jgi:hypothetical protein